MVWTKLKFAFAESSSKNPPHKFLCLDGGKFPMHSSCGQLEVSRFSLYAVFSRIVPLGREQLSRVLWGQMFVSFVPKLPSNLLPRVLCGEILVKIVPSFLPTCRTLGRLPRVLWGSMFVPKLPSNLLPRALWRLNVVNIVPIFSTSVKQRSIGTRD